MLVIKVTVVTAGTGSLLVSEETETTKDQWERMRNIFLRKVNIDEFHHAETSSRDEVPLNDEDYEFVLQYCPFVKQGFYSIHSIELREVFKLQGIV